MKKYFICLAALGLMLLSGTALASNQFNIPLVGQVTLPKYVTFDKGDQKTISLEPNSLAIYLARHGATDISAYTMTYANPPDFTYGWAFSCRLGIPYLQDAGLFEYKDSPVDKQLSVIADSLNKEWIARGASFNGTAPLVQTEKGKKGTYEGSFVLTFREKDITYKEAYYAVLQSDGYFVNLAVINSDAQQQAVTDSLAEMMKKRKPAKTVSLLDLSHRGTSLSQSVE